jgi:hypothetical protein
MAEKVIIGRNCQLKIVYDDTPHSFRVEAFSENDEAELRKRQFLGAEAPDVDYIENGFAGDCMVLDAGKRLDAITEDIRARSRANLPPKALQITLTKVYRDGVTTPATVTFRDLAMTVGTQMGGRTDDVKRPIKWIAANRTFTD